MSRQNGKGKKRRCKSRLRSRAQDRIWVTKMQPSPLKVKAQYALEQ